MCPRTEIEENKCPLCPQSVIVFAYLEGVINQSQDVLDRLLLGDVSHQVQKGLCTLSKNKNIDKKTQKDTVPPSGY